MSRQALLIRLLLVIAAAGLPIIAMEQALGRVHRETEQVMAELAPLQLQYARLQKRQEAIASFETARRELEARLLQGDAYQAIEEVLTEAAAQSGMRVRSFEISGPAPVEELPFLVAYEVNLSVRGTEAQYVELLRILEEHPLLIRLPDLALRLRTDQEERVQTVLRLTFFGPGPDSPSGD